MSTRKSVKKSNTPATFAPVNLTAFDAHIPNLFENTIKVSSIRRLIFSTHPTFAHQKYYYVTISIYMYTCLAYRFNKLKLVGQFTEHGPGVNNLMRF